jgi:hypothetical protein
VADGWHVPRCRHHFVAAQTSSATLRLIAELGDHSRFANPRQLMAYLGLGAIRAFERCQRQTR